MNTTTTKLLILTILVVAACADKDDPAPAEIPTARKYDIKSGIMEFEQDFAGIKSTKILYFDDYGSKERVEVYEDGLLESCVFSDGKTRYTLHAEAKIAYRVDQPGDRGWEMEFHSWDEIRRLPNYQEDYKKVENFTVVGKNCEAYQYKDIAVFAGWNGLTLYHKQNPGILIQAIKLEEDVKHDAAIFTVPSGFTVKELP